MVKQIIATGSVANDGTGDTLRSAGQKINQNFTEIYDTIGANGAVHQVSFDSTSVVYEGALADANETRLKAVEPTDDHIILLPDSSGTIDLIASPSTLTNKTLVQPKIDSADISRLSIRDLDSSHNYIIVPSNIADHRTITLPALAEDDVITFNSHTQTLANKTLYHPRIQQWLFDSVGQPYIEFDRQGTQSHIKLSNANSPSINVVSDNANAFLEISGQGTSGVQVNKLFTLAETIDSNLAHTTAKGEKGFLGSGVILCNKPSALGTIVLADGTSPGEQKIFVNKNNGLATIQPTNFAGTPTQFYLRLNSVAQVIWDGSNWHLANGVDSLNGTKPLAYTN